MSHILEGTWRSRVCKFDVETLEVKDDDDGKIEIGQIDLRTGEVRRSYHYPRGSSESDFEMTGKVDELNSSNPTLFIWRKGADPEIPELPIYGGKLFSNAGGGAILTTVGMVFTPSTRRRLQEEGKPEVRAQEQDESRMRFQEQGTWIAAKP